MEYGAIDLHRDLTKSAVSNLGRKRPRIWLSTPLLHPATVIRTGRCVSAAERLARNRLPDIGGPSGSGGTGFSDQIQEFAP